MWLINNVIALILACLSMASFRACPLYSITRMLAFPPTILLAFTELALLSSNIQVFYLLQHCTFCKCDFGGFGLGCPSFKACSKTTDWLFNSSYLPCLTYLCLPGLRRLYNSGANSLACSFCSFFEVSFWALFSVGGSFPLGCASSWACSSSSLQFT